MATPSTLALALLLAAPAQGHLTVETEPTTEIAIDGQAMGQTPLQQFALPPGTHELRLTSSAHRIHVVRTVKIQAGQDTTMRLELDGHGSRGETIDAAPAVMPVVAPVPPVPPTGLSVPPPAPAAPAAPAAIPAPPAAPASPAPPPPPVMHGPLSGEWPSRRSGKRVSIEDKMSVDDAVTEITEQANWGLVLNTGRAGDEPVLATLSDVPAEEALIGVLGGSPFVAHRLGSLITVARPGPEHPVNLGPPSGKRVDYDDQTSLDDALQHVGEEAGWNVVLHTGRAGDATVRVRMEKIPVEQAFAGLVWGTPLSVQRHGAIVTVSSSDSAPEAPREVLEGFDTPIGKTFTGEFENTPADQAVRKILDAAGLSVVMPKGSYRPITAHFKDAAVEDALRAVCAEAGLSAVRRGTVVTVARNGPTLGFNFQFPGFTASVHSDDAQEAAEEAREEAEDARREAQEEAEEARREAQESAREAAQEAADAQGSDGNDRVSTGDVTLGPGERVRDLVSVHGNARLGPGAHARDVTALAGSVEIGPGAIVDHDVRAFGGDIHVAPGAEVGHEATSVGGKVHIDPGAQVHGFKADVNIPSIPVMPGMPTPHEQHGSLLFTMGWVVAKFGLYFALGLILLVGWPRGIERVVHALQSTPARSTAVGLLGSVAIPVLALLLIVTLIGIILLPVEAILVMLGSLLGFSALAVLIGRVLPLHRKLSPVGQLAAGTAIITVATSIPTLGSVIAVLAWVVVIGAVLATRLGSQDAGSGPTFPIADAIDADAKRAP
ncbi:MAG: PEGA domain-containing protein [Deltaproteobacteria bacterium]|nr:PEGA domain-containing protein [Deltaproteobacteria bacterium]